MTFPDEVYDEMLERCDQVSVFTRRSEDRDRPQAALGAIIRCRDEGFMAVECGQHPDDSAFVTIRRFDPLGEQIAVEVIEVDGSVLVSG